jgi:hypothetical protein
MAYVPDWERLPDALRRLAAAGLSKSVIQRDICRAIVDRKIRIRLLAEIPDAKWSGQFVGSHVAIPQDLSPRDFDWRKSLPKRPWQHGDHPFVRVHLTLIELCSADVTLVLCADSGVPKRSNKGNSRARTQRSRGKNPLRHQEARRSIAEPTFDPSEWITLGQAAQILRLERDLTDGSSRLRLIELLRRKPDVACVVTAAMPLPADAKMARSGLMLLPDRCLWAGRDEIDWAASTVRAFPLFSATDMGNSYPQDQTLGIRVNRSAVVDTAQQERDAEARSRASKYEVAMRLFDELFWPVPQVVAWIAFRNPQMIEASVRAATWYDKSPEGRALKDRNPQGTLLRALQDGSLQALLDGSPLPREKWATATGRAWPDDVRFRRENVLALWAPESEPESQTHAPAPPAAPNLPVDPLDISKRATIWRADRIERFTARQRRVREWINFAEIAEWCSREDGSIVANEEKRAAAFDILQTDLLAGDFDENGRSRVFYLHPEIKKSEFRVNHLRMQSTTTTMVIAADRNIYRIAGFRGRCLSAGLQSIVYQNHRRDFGLKRVPLYQRRQVETRPLLSKPSPPTSWAIAN